MMEELDGAKEILDRWYNGEITDSLVEDLTV